jgi:hypothetical protein
MGGGTCFCGCFPSFFPANFVIFDLSFPKDVLALSNCAAKEATITFATVTNSQK